MNDKIDSMTLMEIMTMSSKSDRPLSEDSIRDIAKFTDKDPDELAKEFLAEWKEKQGDSSASVFDYDSAPFVPPYRDR